MRISTSMQYNTQLGYLQTANSRVDSASQQYNTGLKFQTAGQSPSGMASKIKYTADIEAYKQYAVNAGIVADSLAQEETALGQIWSSLGSIRTRLVQAINGTMDDAGRAALAEDIKQSQAQIFDLMNTKNAEGEYIFSGANSSRPTYTVTTDGQYICQADGSNKYVIVSPTNKIQVTDSGLNVFENTQLAHTFTSVATPAGALVTSGISDYDQFNDMYKEIYSYADNADNNLTLQFGPTFDAEGNQILAENEFALIGPEPDNKELDRGQIKDGIAEVMGMEFTLGENTAGASIDIKLEPPEQGNILNELTEIINLLNVPKDEWNNQDPPITNSMLTQKLSTLQYSIDLSQKQVDSYRGLVGSRQANIDDIIYSDQTLSDIKSEAKANISEVDTFTAVSDLIQSQAALQVAQQTYQIVHSSNLFDYI